MDNFKIEGNTLVKYLGKERIVNIPEGIEIIGDYAFYNNLAIQEVYFPKSIIKIGKDVFEGCSELKYVKIPSSINIINSEAFFFATRLEKVEFYDYEGMIIKNDGVIGFNAFVETSIQEFDIPEGIKTVGWAFDSRALKRLYISSTVEDISEYVIDAVIKLENIIINENNKTFKMINGSLCNLKEKTLLRAPTGYIPGKEYINKINKRAFSDAREVKKIEIPNHIISIGDFPFCGFVEEVIFPSSIKKYGIALFQGNGRLKSVTFLGKVKEISDNFIYCNNSKELKIYFKKGLTGKIGANTFGKYAKVYIDMNKDEFDNIKSDNMGVHQIYMLDDNKKYVLVYEKEIIEEKKEEKIDYASLIYNHSFVNEYFDDYLWLSDRQLYYSVFPKEISYNGLFPLNKSTDLNIFVSIVHPTMMVNKEVINVAKIFYNDVFKLFPDLENDFDALFVNEPYLVVEKADLRINFKRNDEFIDFIIKLKDMHNKYIFDLIKDHSKDIKEKKQLNALKKILKPNELFVKSAIAINTLGEIFVSDVDISKKCLDLFNKNNENWYFNDGIEEYQNIINELKKIIDKFVKEYNTIDDNQELVNQYNNLLKIRRKAYKDFHNAATKYYWDYIE